MTDSWVDKWAGEQVGKLVTFRLPFFCLPAYLRVRLLFVCFLACFQEVVRGEARSDVGTHTESIHEDASTTGSL